MGERGREKGGRGEGREGEREGEMGGKDEMVTLVKRIVK